MHVLWPLCKAGLEHCAAFSPPAPHKLQPLLLYSERKPDKQASARNFNLSFRRCHILPQCALFLFDILQVIAVVFLTIDMKRLNHLITKFSSNSRTEPSSTSIHNSVAVETVTGKHCATRPN